MLSSLGKINNTFLRSITAASTSLAMATLVAAVVVGLIKPKDNSANKTAIYASVVAFFAGAVIGLGVKDNNSPPAQSKLSNNDHDHVWKGWRDFEVIKKERESQEITSFYLQPLDGGKLPNFQPGQFLTIKLDLPNQPRPVIRAYSISDYSLNQNEECYRLSIKRESSPSNLDVPPGIASHFMHDHVIKGSIISCKPPSGRFCLDPNSSVPAVLLSNGVGITPMISMAQACAQLNPQRHVWFVHGARNSEYHACRQEVNAISQSYSNLHIHYRYSRPILKDAGNYHSQGYVDKQLLEDQIIPEIHETDNNFTNAEYFLCGSNAFMDSLRAGLKELNVPEDNVFFESFGGGQTKGKSKATAKSQRLLHSESGQTWQGNAESDTTKPSSQVYSTEGTSATQLHAVTVDQVAVENAELEIVESAEVVFTQSDKILTWTPDDGTLLEFAEANGIEADYSCCQGVCMTCLYELQEGEVEYVESPAIEPDEGMVLICVCQPKTANIVVNL